MKLSFINPLTPLICSELHFFVALLKTHCRTFSVVHHVALCRDGCNQPSTASQSLGIYVAIFNKNYTKAVFIKCDGLMTYVE